MDHFIDIYNKRPDLCEKLLSLDNVKINLKVDGKPFQVLMNENELEYHGRSGDESHVGPIIDEHTRLYSRPINHAISIVEKFKDEFSQYNFLTFEVINEKMLLTAAVDNTGRFVESSQEIRDIAKYLSTDVMPTLWEGKLSESQVDAIVNILESGIVPEKMDFVKWVKEQFGEYEFFPDKLISASPDFIEGIVFFFPVGDKIVEYKLVDPTYRKLMEERKKALQEEREKNADVYEQIYETFVNYFENNTIEKNKTWELTIEESFLNMMSNPKTYNKLMNLGSKIRINESTTYSVQLDMVIPELAKQIRKNGNIYKQLFEEFDKLFYKEKKRGYIISKEFQERVNNVIKENK